MNALDKPIIAIWDEFGAGLRRFIGARVGSDEIADDILQDVFIKIHTRLDTLQDPAKLQSWIYQITRNAIADYYRRVRPVPPEPILALSGEEVTGDAEMRAALASSLREMVDSLPEEYRQALVLTVFEGLSQEELSERLGISLSGAKSRVQRARAKLRDMLFECCHFEFDRLGKVINYYPRGESCTVCGDGSNQDCC